MCCKKAAQYVRFCDRIHAKVYDLGYDYVDLHKAWHLLIESGLLGDINDSNGGREFMMAQMEWYLNSEFPPKERSNKETEKGGE